MDRCGQRHRSEPVIMDGHAQLFDFLKSTFGIASGDGMGTSIVGRRSFCYGTIVQEAKKGGHEVRLASQREGQGAIILTVSFRLAELAGRNSEPVDMYDYLAVHWLG